MRNTGDAPGWVKGAQARGGREAPDTQKPGGMTASLEDPGRSTEAAQVSVSPRRLCRCQQPGSGLGHRLHQTSGQECSEDGKRQVRTEAQWAQGHAAWHL